MDNQILQAIQELTKELKSFKQEFIEEKKISSDFREEVRSEFVTVNSKLDRLEENEPTQIMSLLNVMANKHENSSKFLKARYVELDEKVFNIEQRINN